jgi:acyl carrier protein
MYKTGDIVRHHVNGQLEYIGRVDHQIKIRGFRVELGEIENALLQQPQVREAIVLAREDQEGDKRLVAYVVPETADANRKELRRLLQQALRATLPSHMVPTAFVWLDNLPLMLNGKVDHKQLPAPTFDRSELEHEHTPPRNETESKLVQLVAEVLQIERVGVHDNFFELGGHSLLGVQLISRIRSEMNVEVPVHHLFESPTVAELALIVERESLNSQQNNAPAMVARSRQARTVRK